MRCVILDDYQGVALSHGDWTSLADVEVSVVREHLADEDAVVGAVADAEILVVMRERTPLRASLLDRPPGPRPGLTPQALHDVLGRCTA